MAKAKTKATKTPKAGKQVRCASCGLTGKRNIAVVQAVVANRHALVHALWFAVARLCKHTEDVANPDPEDLAALAQARKALKASHLPYVPTYPLPRQ
jgi:hypothetical protein